MHRTRSVPLGAGISAVIGLLHVAPLVAEPGVVAPFPVLPARIQAEDFDSGGEGIGYHDTTPENLGGRYRLPSGVDIGNTFPDDGTYEVGFIVAGEWLQYTFEVLPAGRPRQPVDFVLRLRMAQYGPGGRFHVEVDGVEATASLRSPDTGTYRHWVTVPVAILSLTPGRHFLRLVFDENGSVGGVMNLNWLELAPRTLAAPGRIQAEDFDPGEGTGYHDNTPLNAGDLYRRIERVDIADTFSDEDYSVAVDGITAGEWLRYTFQAERTASYVLRLRLAQFGTGGVFHVELDGADVTGAVAVPDTTSYANWITLPLTTTRLTAGQHALRIAFDRNGTIGGVMNLNWLELVPEGPVVAENRLEGSTAWIDQAAVGGLNDITYSYSPLKGYASATSVDRGGALSFYVHSEVPGTAVTLQVFRMGYYNGSRFLPSHGRLLRTASFAAGPQPPCGPAAGGVIECDWNESYRLNLPPSWTSGVYIAKLSAARLATPDGIAGNYVPFVVRDDARQADFLYVQPVTTYQAYNNHPSVNCFCTDGENSRSLYEFNSAPGTCALGTLGIRAERVSFRRPHCGNGAGGGAGGGAGEELLNHELNLIAFLERQGVDVAYATSIDLHRMAPDQLRRYRAVISPSHDEYWSTAMRDNMEEVRDRGVHIAFFGANAAYWQVRFEDGEETMVCYKEDHWQNPLDPNPHEVLKTARFRRIGRPEQWLIGVQFYDGCCARVDYYWPLQNLAADSWAFAASPRPITPETQVELLVGHEIDAFESYDDSPVSDGPPVFVFDGGSTKASGPARIEPERVQALATSNFQQIGLPEGAMPGDPLGPVGPVLTQSSSLYQAPSGAWVFASGTLGWALGLADVGRYYQENDILKNATANILFRFLAGATDRAPTNLARGAVILARSSYEDSWWSTANVIDGRRNSAFGTSMGYSSEVGWTINHEEWIEVRLPAIRTFSRVILYPRNDAGYAGQGFPRDFFIQVWDGTAWLDRVLMYKYPQPEGTGQSFTFGPDTTDRIRILATSLSPVDGHYLLQFAEIEVLAQDSDSDGWADDSDNCPTLWNADQLDADGDGVGNVCDATLSFFRRGDCNGDGRVIGEVTDAIVLLRFNFLGGPAPSCLAACDANGDGEVRGVVTDAVYLLTFNFLGTSPPPEPFPSCGPGTPADRTLGCAAPPTTCGPGG